MGERSAKIVFNLYQQYTGEAMNRFPSRFDSYSHCHKWTCSIIKSYGLAIRRKTHNQSGLDEAKMGSIHLDFIMHFKRLVDFNGIPNHLCVNMDETGCHFDMSSNRTIHYRGSRDENKRSTNNPSCCTVFLSVELDGSKL